MRHSVVLIVDVGLWCRWNLSWSRDRSWCWSGVAKQFRGFWIAWWQGFSWEWLGWVVVDVVERIRRLCCNWDSWNRSEAIERTASWADGSLDQWFERGWEDSEVDVGVIELGDKEDRHTIGDDPDGVGLIDLYVSWEHESFVISVDNVVILRRVRKWRIPAADSVLVDQVEELNSSVAHDSRCRVSIASSLLLEERKVVETFFESCRVTENSGGDTELTMRSQWAEVHSSKSIALKWRQRHAKDSLLTPLEVQAGNVEVSSQWIGEEEAVSKSPRTILFPWIRHQTIAQLVREVSVDVFAVLSDIDGNIGDESIWVGVFWSELVSANASVGSEVKHVQCVWTDVFRGIANANGASIKYPKTAALVSCVRENSSWDLQLKLKVDEPTFDAVHSGKSIGAVTSHVVGQTGIWNQRRRATRCLIHVDVVEYGWNAWRETEVKLSAFVAQFWRDMCVLSNPDQGAKRCLNWIAGIVRINETCTSAVIKSKLQQSATN